MTKLITEHKDYLLLVDTGGEGWSSIALCYNNDGTIGQPINRNSFKIIAHFPINNAPRLEGVPLLPELPKCLEEYYCDNCGKKDPETFPNTKLTKCCSTYKKESTNAFYNTKDEEGKTVYSIGKKYLKKTELPKQEEDVEQLAEDAAKFEQDPQLPDMVEYVATKRGFIKGYKAASKKYSEEDMIDMFVAGYHCDGKGDLLDNLGKKYLKSLSPTLTPIDFISEYEDFCQLLKITNVSLCSRCQILSPECKRVKIVDGVLQGTYKFK